MDSRNPVKTLISLRSCKREKKPLQRKPRLRLHRILYPFSIAFRQSDCQPQWYDPFEIFPKRRERVHPLIRPPSPNSRWLSSVLQKTVNVANWTGYLSSTSIQFRAQSSSWRWVLTPLEGYGAHSVDVKTVVCSMLSEVRPWTFSLPVFMVSAR